MKWPRCGFAGTEVQKQAAQPRRHGDGITFGGQQLGHVWLVRLWGDSMLAWMMGIRLC